MGCPFGEFSLHLFHSGEFGVAAWVARVAWASDKGVLPSAPSFRFNRKDIALFFFYRFLFYSRGFRRTC